jgi:hypothetical protein
MLSDHDGVQPKVPVGLQTRVIFIRLAGIRAVVVREVTQPADRIVQRRAVVAVVQHATVRVPVVTPPLEEERHISSLALIAQRPRLVRVDRPCVEPLPPPAIISELRRNLHAQITLGVAQATVVVREIQKLPFSIRGLKLLRFLSRLYGQ